MSATDIAHDWPSPESRAFMTPVLGAPRHTTDLELMHSRLPSIKLVSPVSVSIVRIAGRKNDKRKKKKKKTHHWKQNTPRECQRIACRRYSG